MKRSGGLPLYGLLLYSIAFDAILYVGGYVTPLAPVATLLAYQICSCLLAVYLVGKGNPLQPNPRAWPLTFLVFTNLLAPVVAAGFHSASGMNGERINAIAHSVDVTLGVLVAYMAFDRFRYHHRVAALVDQVRILTPPALLERFESGKANSSGERSLLVLLHMAGDENLQVAVAGQEEKLTGLEFFLSWRCQALHALLINRYDRKAVTLLLVSLATWQVSAGFIEITIERWNIPANLIYVVFALVVLAFAAPAVSFALAELALQSVKRATAEWRADLTKHLEDEAEKAKPPELPIATASIEATFSKALAKQRPKAGGNGKSPASPVGRGSRPGARSR